MINSYKKLTGKYLKAAKKRTILTILGIVLSVALISTIGLFFYSMQMSLVEEAKDSYGAQHLIFTEVDENLASKITNNPKVSRYGFYSFGKEANVTDNIKIGELSATDKALELLPYKIKEGKLPEKDGEVAIEKWVINYINKSAKIGDTIKVSDKEYKLTGVLENNIKSQIDNKGTLLSKDNNIDRKNSMLAVEISSKTNISTAIEELKSLAPKDTVMENEELLFRMGIGEGSGMEGLYLTISIIIGIVVVCTIAVIYNSFQISVVERIKQFGLLRAVGATPKQIRNIVLREATILALIGVPLGLLFGILAMDCITLAFKIIGGDSVFPIKTSISPMILGISGIVGAVSIYISALIPASFAGKISPLVAISSRNSITKEKIKRRNNKLIQKIFGFEGALASKNIKRNRKRYRVTVFSIVISVVLFITFKSFMDMSLNITDTPNESSNMHFSVIRDYQATEDNVVIEERIIKDIKNLNTVEEVYRIYDTPSFDAAISKDKEVDEVKAIKGIYEEAHGKSVIPFSSIVVYDRESLEVAKKYLASGNIDMEKMNKENGVIVINKNSIFNAETEKVYRGPIANIRVGDEIELQYYDDKGKFEKKEFGEDAVKKVKVMAVLHSDPFNYRGSNSGIKMISTAEVVEALSGKKDVKPINLNIKLKDIESEEKTLTGIENIIKEDSYLSIINNIDNNRQEKSSTLMMQILVYGFVIVVSLIGSVNIINTLTTNIILRKREFAALKSIGLTQRGLKKMITFEGVLYGIVGTIYGSIIGCLASYGMYTGLGGIREFQWSIPWDAVIISGAFAIIIGYISVLAPLRRMKNENLIEAIREE